MRPLKVGQSCACDDPQAIPDYLTGLVHNEIERVPVDSPEKVGDFAGIEAEAEEAMLHLSVP